MDANNDGLTSRQRAGRARMEKLTLDERKALSSKASKARWDKAKALKAGENASIESGDSTQAIENKGLPIALWPGQLADSGIECYVLDDKRRIISRTGATTFLTDRKGGGNLESYTSVQAVADYMPPNLTGEMVEFALPGVVNKTVKGMEAETFVEICRAYVAAWQANALESDAQKAIAARAAMFLGACAKVGLIALIDEATGYQYERPVDALQFKLKLFLVDEMRKWEKTFPDDLWVQFGRLTNWKGSLHQRPKYWGKLVMKLIYEYLDPDVAQWLRDNAPKPIQGQNYHLWMTEQYGLKKLIEHIWKVIGVASTCQTMAELETKMEELYGKTPGFQYELKLVGAEWHK
jgi:hypothetical protein